MGSIVRLLRHQRRLLLVAVVLAVLAGALELLPYWLVYWMARLLAQGDTSPAPSLASGLAMLAFAMLLASVLRLLVFGGANIASHRAAFQVQRELRCLLLRKLHTLPLPRLQGKTGDLKKTIIDDVNGLEHAIGHTLPDMIAGLALPLCASVLLVLVDLRMTLVSLALLPVAAWAHTRSFRGLDALMARWHGADMQANTALLEHVQGLATLKAHHRVASSMRSLHDAVHALAGLAESVTRHTAVPYAVFFVALSTNLLVVLPAGVALYALGSLAWPQLVLFVTLGAGLTAPLLRVLTAFGSLQRQLGGAHRITNVLDRPGVPDLPNPVRPRDWTITFDSITVHAPAAPAASGTPMPAELRCMLHDVTLHIPAGTVTAIVGPSGAGKSTLLGLLTGTATPSSGCLRIGGVALQDIALSTRSAMVAAVFQDSMLFHGTLRQNLLMARPDATAAQIRAAVHAASLDDVCQRLPSGLDSSVAERGGSLSGGERQRVAIARAIVKDAPIVILDEASSALDADNNHAVQLGLAQLSQGRTVLSVTHDLNQARRADRIVIMDAGCIVASGTHATLLESCALYARLWDRQQRSAAWALQSNSHRIHPETAPFNKESPA